VRREPELRVNVAALTRGEPGDPKRLQAVNFGARDRPACDSTRWPNILTRISCGVVARQTASRHTSTTLSEIPIVSYIHDLEPDS